MKKIKNVIKWTLSVFFLLATMAYFPSITSLFMALLGVFLLPIAPIQGLIQKYIKAKWLRVVVAIILFFVAMLSVPSDPADQNTTEPTDTTGAAVVETSDGSTDGIIDETTEGTIDAVMPTDEATKATTDTATEGTEEVPSESSPEASEETVETEPSSEATEPVTESTMPPESVPPEVGSFEVHFIDVGQADAALILCDGKAMLIDGGNVEDSSRLYTYLKKHNVTHLDYVIGTHAHEDHIGGIAGALNYASVGVVYCPNTSYSTDAFDNFVKAVEKHGKSITVPTAGTTFSLGSASCKVLAVNTSSDTNNSSIVLRITYGDTSFLFTGDAEREVEQAILNRGEELKSTVLKVGHHGSETSTSYVWLREIMPEYAVISVGSGNSYGHPTEEVLSRLRDAEVQTFRTDMQGDIVCVSDGQTVTFTVSRNADADTLGGIGNNSTQKPTEPEETEGVTEPEETETHGTHYVLNTNSKKFHYEDCASAKKISEKNRQDYYGTREELIDMGYSPCGNCDP